MRIAKIDVVPVEFKLRQVTAIAYEAPETAPNIVVRVETDGGEVGWGNAAPDTHVTGETPESVERVLREQFAPAIHGADPLQIRPLWDELNRLAPGNPTAVAAIDIALYDLLGKICGLPLYELLGHSRDAIGTFVTLGIEETEVSVSKARALCGGGFRALKVKCGLAPDKDVERIRAIRSAVDTSTTMCIDANQGYDAPTALWVTDQLKDQRIEFIEQPTPANDLAALAEVAHNSPIPVMADEAALSPADISRVIERCGVQAVNIKFMKIGGITGALAGIALAQAAGIPVMLGCMDESVISIAAALHVALVQNGVKYADLDGHLDIVDDVATRGVVLERGLMRAVDAPGLGVDVSESFIDRAR